MKVYKYNVTYTRHALSPNMLEINLKKFRISLNFRKNIDMSHDLEDRVKTGQLNGNIAQLTKTVHAVNLSDVFHYCRLPCVCVTNGERPKIWSTHFVMSATGMSQDSASACVRLHAQTHPQIFSNIQKQKLETNKGPEYVFSEAEAMDLMMVLSGKNCKTFQRECVPFFTRVFREDSVTGSEDTVSEGTIDTPLGEDTHTHEEQVKESIQNAMLKNTSKRQYVWDSSSAESFERISSSWNATLSRSPSNISSISRTTSSASDAFSRRCSSSVSRTTSNASDAFGTSPSSPISRTTSSASDAFSRRISSSFPTGYKPTLFN